ncbi:DUF2147 domain-containing protein [Haloferula sargassicola]|uniref:DUF2147 domain-containing protein n=1 Tax=Haloferula sargassicola TaxID=490096 RepID=A0ABP9UX25_9BACT
MKTLLLGLLAAVILPLHADPIEGLWKKDDGQATIRLTIENGKLTGRLTSVADKSRTTDTHNPDASKRSRKLIGLTIVQGFWKDGDKWTGGTVYDSSRGKTYQGNIWLEGADTLKMRGYLGVSALGRTATWKRIP